MLNNKHKEQGFPYRKILDVLQRDLCLPSGGKTILKG